MCFEDHKVLCVGRDLISGRSLDTNEVLQMLHIFWAGSVMLIQWTLLLCAHIQAIL